MQLNSKKRVVITGMGVISTFGFNIKDFWENIKIGKNNFAKLKVLMFLNLKRRLVVKYKTLTLRHFSQEIMKLKRWVGQNSMRYLVRLIV